MHSAAQPEARGRLFSLKNMNRLHCALSQGVFSQHISGERRTSRVLNMQADCARVKEDGEKCERRNRTERLSAQI